MPIYYNSQGNTVSSHEALTDSGKLRPGYRSTIAQGEHIGFDISMMDAKSAPASTYLTDGVSAADRSRMFAAARYQQQASDASGAAHATQGSTIPEAPAAVHAGQSSCIVIDALRAARYS